MNLSEVAQIVFSVLGALALYILNDLKKSVNEATKSVSKLNEKVGVIIEKTERHDEELKDMRSKHDQVRERLHGLGNEINQIKAKNYE